MYLHADYYYGKMLGTSTIVTLSSIKIIAHFSQLCDRLAVFAPVSR